MLKAMMPKTGVGRGLALTMVVSAVGLGWTSYRIMATPPPVWEKHVVPHGPLVPLASNLWQVTGQVEPRSDVLMRNMVVYRLPRSSSAAEDGSYASSASSVSGDGMPSEPKEESKDELLLHSVIALSDQGMQELDALGRVTYILVPSPFHRLDAAVYKQRYPEAKVICPKDIRKQVSKVVPVDATVEEVFGQDLSALGLRAYVPGGGIYITELAYELPLEHDEEPAKSLEGEQDKKALVFCDLIANVSKAPFNVTILGIVTGGEYPTVPWMARYVFTRNRANMKRFWETLAQRDDIEVIAMAHGEAIKGEPEEIKKRFVKLASLF